MGVEPKIGVVKPPKSSILIGFSIIFTIHFGVPLFLETPIYIYIYIEIGEGLCQYASMFSEMCRSICPTATPGLQTEMDH